MTMKCFVLLSAALVGGLDALSSGRVKMEPGVTVYDAQSSSWAKLDRPQPMHSMTFAVALRVDEDQRAELEDIFWKVSDPNHEDYGKHRNLEEITKILAVPIKRVERVRDHFVAAGATETTVAPNRDMITVTMPVSGVEAVLETTIHIFGHNHHDVRILRASSEYSLPESIARDVVMVGELLQFPGLRSKTLQDLVGGSGDWPNACDASGCKGLVTPAVLAQRYKLPSSVKSLESIASTNSMAVSEFQGQYYKPSDLESFGSSCHRDVSVAKNVGANQNSAGVESELDIEYIRSVAPEVPLTVIYDEQYSLLNWANSLGSMSDPPLVVSVSYGNDEKQQTSTEYMYTSNTAFMKAGARGISILFASGDQGVCGREGCDFTPDFKPDFPAGSPYIPAVGGTNFAGSSIGEEEAWQAGGGGFSDTFAIPDYQKEAVAAYKSNADANLPAQKYWNNTGRGYPDVAALGGTKTPYCVATGGRFAGVAGTSASCPVVAGIFAKLNGLRLAAGKPPLGFLNPFIYKNPSGFQDVTKGCNKASSSHGFTAVKGWDAATGFGTPDYEALAKLVMASSASTVVV
jgi:tripeptidyl-peptidase-1